VSAGMQDQHLHDAVMWETCKRKCEWMPEL
jgi:hypothetical protein